MTDRELMQMALEALSYPSIGIPYSVSEQTTDALRARLAQPEPEPVAWITDGGKGELWWHQSVKFDDDGNLIGENPDDIPLYTAPPQRKWQGLSMEDLTNETDITNSSNKDIFDFRKAFWCGARWAEAKLKEKNND